jgi:FKBP-type peptidyl-prolyl cis-trans isomerase
MASRWMSLAFFVMVLYIGYSASQNSTPAPIPKTVTPTITAEHYPALVEMTDVENWKRKLDPDYAARMNCTLDRPTEKNGLKFSAVEQLAGEGAGAGAQCGDTVTLALVVWNAAGTQTFAGEVTLALGSRQVAAGLDFGVLGMQVGAERLLTLPPYALTRSKATTGHEAVRKALPPDKVSVVQARRLK